MKFTRRFTKDGTNPFDGFRYGMRNCKINKGESIEVEVPESWSQTATDILAQKYLCRKELPGGGKEYSIKQVADRLAGCWRYWGETLGYFDSEKDAKVFYDEAK